MWSRSGYPENAFVSVAYGPSFLRPGFERFALGDIRYLLNLDRPEVTAIKVIGMVADSTVFALVHGGGLASATFDVVVKLPRDLTSEVKRVLSIVTILGAVNVTKPGVAESFLGFGSSVERGITLVATPHGAAPALDAASWRAGTRQKGSDH